MTAEVQPQKVRATDPRPARTRAHILSAIESLWVDREEINVASIVTRAAISRSTFYSHFPDIHDIAVQLFQELQSEIDSLELPVDDESEPGAAASATLTAFFTRIETRRDLFAAVLGPAASGQTIRTVRRMLSEKIHQELSQRDELEVDTRVAAAFVGSGLLAVIIDWLLDPEPRPGEIIAAELMHLIPRWNATDG